MPNDPALSPTPSAQEANLEDFLAQIPPPVVRAERPRQGHSRHHQPLTQQPARPRPKPRQHWADIVAFGGALVPASFVPVLAHS